MALVFRFSAAAEACLCPAHLTLQQAVLCVTCSLLCRSLICGSVCLFGRDCLAGRDREVSQIRQICVAELDTRRFGHDCVVCGLIRKVQGKTGDCNRVEVKSGVKKQGRVWFSRESDALSFCALSCASVPPSAHQYVTARSHTNTSWRAFPAPQN